MEIGSNIRKLREEKGFTQKQLAELLHVTPQAVSRWEKNEVEPNLDIINNIAEIFEVSFEEVVQGKKNNENNITDYNAEHAKNTNETYDDLTVTESKTATPPERYIMYVCEDCNKAIYNDEKSFKETIQIRERHGRTHHTVTSTKTVCEQCHLIREKKAAEEKAQRLAQEKAEKAREARRAYGWSIAVGILAAIIYIIVMSDPTINELPVFQTVLYGILSVYAVFSLLFCLIKETYIQGVFAWFISLTFVKMPGVIFEFSLDGLKFLIAVKLLFWLIGFLLSFTAFCLAFIVCAPLSMFTFPFYAKTK